MFVDTTINGVLTCTSTASGGTAYVVMPYKATVADVQGVVNASPGSSSFDVTLSAPSTSSVSSVGVLAFSTSSGSLSTGATGTYTKDASSGSSALSAGHPLKLDVSSGGITGSFDIHFTVKLNPYTN